MVFVSRAVVVVSFLASPLRGGLSDLPTELLEYRPPTPNWSSILDARIEAGEPLPDLPDPARAPPDRTTPVELLAYWREEWPWRVGREPTPAVRAKILQAVQDEPSAIPEVLRALPEGEATAKTIAGMMDRVPGESHESKANRRKVRAWVFREGGLLRDQVLADAWSADWEDYRWDDYSDPTLEALQHRAPAEAARVFEKFVRGEDSGLRVVGARLLMADAPPEDAVRWREVLISAAAAVTFPEKARELAVVTLLAADWPGREQWIVESLGQADPGEVHWFMTAVSADPDHWIPLLVRMLGNENRHLHDHAVYLLAQFHLGDSRVDALRPLLPWLMDPGWSAAGRMERLRLIQSVNEVALPESVSGLRHVVRTDDDDANVAYAAEGLADYEVREAIPELKDSLKRCEDTHYREKIMRSIYRLGGYSTDEMLAAVVACYRALPTARDRRDYRSLYNKKKISLEAHLGLFLANQMGTSPDRQLLRAIARHAAGLGEGDATLVASLRNLLAASQSEASRSVLVDALADGSVSAAELARALRIVQEKSWDGSAFRPLIGRAGARGGFAAVLSRDRKAMNGVMAGDDLESISALMAAARLTRDPLPFASVAALLDSKQEGLVATASGYLRDSNDPTARELWERHKADSSTVTGARTSWDPGHFSFRDFDRLEKQLGERLSSSDSPEEVYAILSSGYWGDRGQWYVCVYPDHARAIRDFGEGRLGTCRLSAGQLARVRDYVAKYRVDDLPPLELPIDDGIQMTYVHATRSGIRRVFMNNPPTGRGEVEDYIGMGRSKGIVIYAQLVNLFADLFGELDLELGYGAHVEILIPREQAKIESVWKEGNDLRVLVANSREARHWQRLDPDSGALLGPVGEPAGNEVLDARANLHPEFEIQSDYHFRYPWQVRAGDAVVHPGEFRDQSGLWLCRHSKEPELLAKGTFLQQLVSPDGKWCVAARASGRGWAEPNRAVRINLETKQVFPVDLEPADNFNPEAFVPAHGKFLITRWADRDPGYPRERKPMGPERLEAHLLDAATGKLERVEGDFSVFRRKSFRPLQAIGETDVVWVAKSMPTREEGVLTRVGRYNTKSFTFEPIKEIRGLSCDSSAMWVDGENGMIYAAVHNDLVLVSLGNR